LKIIVRVWIWFTYKIYRQSG